MIGNLNHVAIVVPDLAAAADVYRSTLGAQVSEPVPLPDHGVTTVFVELGNTKIDHQPLAAIAVEIEVHADLAGPAQRQEDQFVAAPPVTHDLIHAA